MCVGLTIAWVDGYIDTNMLPQDLRAIAGRFPASLRSLNLQGSVVIVNWILHSSIHILGNSLGTLGSQYIADALPSMHLTILELSCMLMQCVFDWVYV